MSYVENIIVLGDFNLNFIDWTSESNSSATTISNYNDNLGYSLIDFITLNNLFQFNKIVNINGKIE